MCGYQEDSGGASVLSRQLSRCSHSLVARPLWGQGSEESMANKAYSPECWKYMEDQIKIIPTRTPTRAARDRPAPGALPALSGVLGTGLPGLGTEHLPGALCSGTGSPALGLCSP